MISNPNEGNAETRTGRLTHGELLELRRWNTPTIYNGWEQITSHDAGKDGFNLEEAIDFMPQMGPMIGYAVTVVCEPGNPAHKKNNPNGWNEYRRYMASVPGPKIVVVQDLDKPNFVGAFWGEVNASVHRAFGCVGTIVDGCVRDLDEMNYSGFKAMAKRLCVGHAYSWPVRWDCDVEVFGRRVSPGQLIHADKHGFMVIPEEDEERLLEAARLMDTNECRTLIPAAKGTAGMTNEEILENLERASVQFREHIKAHFNANE
ncbi:MAG: RraA family protein [Acidobacteria bacterium]|nr:RraA family protein [Acidobacteriota bacterium]